MHPRYTCGFGGQVTLINDAGSRMADILVQAVKLAETIRSISIPGKCILGRLRMARENRYHEVLGLPRTKATCCVFNTHGRNR